MVTGVAYSKNDAKITLIGVPDKPGVAADIFEPLDKNQINVIWLFKMYHQMEKQLT